MGIVDNIINGSVFSGRKHTDDEFLKDIYKSVENLDCYNFSITPFTYRESIVFLFKKALGSYKQTHQLS